jgi:demethylmenaquinone methyltransferase/2-methoxy-6-polyprenyl-1,4-benzoquinol methylase
LSSPELIDYYRRRAGEYERIYAWPERQEDLAALRKAIPQALRGCQVLEVACGTGYWTERISHTAKRIVATDIAEEPMALARSKAYGCPVELRVADAYALDPRLGVFDGAFAGFWWSHVPLSRRAAFLESLHARLAPGAPVVMFDNRYVEGAMHPIAERDDEGNTYQRRQLDDGSENRVLKNFPSPEELARDFGRFPGYAYTALRYYWLLEYRRP